MYTSSVDTREPEVLYEPLVLAGWQRHKLAHGDYELGCGFSPNPIVERKSLKNLLNDLATGTLMRQIRELTEATPYPILLIEGNFYIRDGVHLLDSNYTWEQVWNELETLQDMGARIQLTYGISHTIQRLISLVRYYRKNLHESALRQLAGDYRVTCLSLINGVGVEKAKAIMNYYPSIAAVANSTPEELAKINGIGESLANRICKWFQQDSV